MPYDNLKPFSNPPEKRLETEYETAYKDWQTKPSPTTTGNLLRVLQPSIDKGISAHVGESSPTLRSRARIMTANSLANYDPTKSSLGTYVVNNLIGLKRVAGKQNQILHIPERMAIAQSRMRQLEDEMYQETGREPSQAELADRAGISLKKLAKIRGLGQASNEGFFSTMNTGDEGGDFQPAIMGNHAHRIEAIYGDLDPINQKILEWSLGIHGANILQNHRIAAKLGISPAAVSQRKALIQKQIEDSYDWDVL